MCTHIAKSYAKVAPGHGGGGHRGGAGHNSSQTQTQTQTKNETAFVGSFNGIFWAFFLASQVSF